MMFSALLRTNKDAFGFGPGRFQSRERARSLEVTTDCGQQGAAVTKRGGPHRAWSSLDWEQSIGARGGGPARGARNETQGRSSVNSQHESENTNDLGDWPEI